MALVRRRTGSASLGDDVAAEVFEHAWRSIDSLDDGNRVAGWLMRSAIRRVIDRHRSDDRRRLREIRADRAVRPLRPPDDPAEAVAGDTGVDDTRLREALDRLAPMHQEVIMLRFHSDLEPAAAADALGVSASTAGVRLHRAMKALRRELGVEPDVEGRRSS